RIRGGRVVARLQLVSDTLGEACGGIALPRVVHLERAEYRLPGPGKQRQIELLHERPIRPKSPHPQALRTVGRQSLHGQATWHERRAEVEVDDVEVAEAARQQPQALELTDDTAVSVIPDHLVRRIA